MKLLVIMTLLLAGCSTFQSGATRTKARVKDCVMEFLGEDVEGLDAYQICDQIYRKPRRKR